MGGDWVGIGWGLNRDYFRIQYALRRFMLVPMCVRSYRVLHATGWCGLSGHVSPLGSALWDPNPGHSHPARLCRHLHHMHFYLPSRQSHAMCVDPTPYDRDPHPLVERCVDPTQWHTGSATPQAARSVSTGPISHQRPTRAPTQSTPCRAWGGTTSVEIQTTRRAHGAILWTVLAASSAAAWGQTRMRARPHRRHRRRGERRSHLRPL